MVELIGTVSSISLFVQIDIRSLSLWPGCHLINEEWRVDVTDVALATNRTKCRQI